MPRPFHEEGGSEVVHGERREESVAREHGRFVARTERGVLFTADNEARMVALEKGGLWLRQRVTRASKDLVTFCKRSGCISTSSPSISSSCAEMNMSRFPAVSVKMSPLLGDVAMSCTCAAALKLAKRGG